MRCHYVRRAALPAVVFLACAFLLMPHALLAQRTYAAVDLMEPDAPYRDALTRPPKVVSVVQTDQAEGLSGPVAFFRDLRRGVFQRWDPNVAAGQPTGTLPLYGLWSPFSVGFLFLPAWYAIGFKVFLALLFSQAFTYLLLRRLGSAVGPAVLAGVAYTFSGTNLVFVHRVDAVFLLPALFWGLHRLVQRPSGRQAAVVAALVAWAWFEGFPSGWVYCVYAGAAWAAWLALRGAVGLRAFVRRAVLPAAALVWGVALAAVTLVPFLSEVIDRGTLDVRAAATGGHIPSIQVFGLLDLSATGSPLAGPWWSGLNPVESVSHVGMIVAFAVGAGLVAASLGRIRLSAEGAAAWPFFCGLAAVAIVVNFVGTPVLTLLEHVPGVARNPIGRSRFLLSLAVVVLGALALDSWWSRRERAGARASRAAAAGALAVMGATFGLNLVGFARAASAANQLRDVTTHFSVAIVLALVAAAAAAVAARRPSPRVMLGATVALSALLFAQLAWPLRHFTPEAPIGDFYGERSGHRALGALLDGRYRFAASQYNFYPNSGQALGLADLRGLALHSKQFKALVSAFNPQAFGRDPLKINLRREEWNLTSPLLDDLAVRYFAEGTDELPFGRVADDADLTWDRWASTDSLADDVTVGVAPGPVNGMYVPLQATGSCAGARVTLSLLSGARTVATTSRAAFDVGSGWTGFALLGHELAAGDPYRFTATTSTPGCHLAMGLVGGRAARQFLLEDPGQAVQLVSTDEAWIYERPTAWPLVSAHQRWRAFPDQAELLAWAAARPPGDADVAAYVGSGPPSPPVGGSGPAPVVDRFDVADNSVSARVTSASRSLLVVSENLADGWTAQVDGRTAPLVAVDGALMGVFVPPGDHDVALHYLPRSFVAGSAVTGVAVLAAGAVVGLPVRRRRSSSRRRGLPRSRR
jgi:hypothetical protein